MGPILLAFLSTLASTAGQNIAQSAFGKPATGQLDLSNVFEEIFKKKKKGPKSAFGVDSPVIPMPRGPGSPVGIELASNPVIQAFLNANGAAAGRAL